ncbi:E3 ubiquitin-protein ligase ATL42-like [Cucumis melo]|uniref:RING-type E3 ubiquitin transferase n=1 Tax=Cucumis melo TaxID=3656 RepID=A0A1S3CHH4_CUCME|nr:E3 ubiquitin-protein ligase ATL42-like [Cucumis melo]
MGRFNRIIMIILIIFLFPVIAQAPSPPKAGSVIPQNFTIVIGILSIMFSMVFILVVYAKFCHPTSHFRGEPQANLRHGLLRSDSRFSGVDQKVIDALPFFRFSSLKGSREGLECAVCLSKFEDIEVLRLLPKCKHAFHIGCIDHWLEKHSSCPICRCRISVEDVAFFKSNSIRLIRNNSQPDLPQDSHMELFVLREENHHYSSRSNDGTSFRKIGKEMLGAMSSSRFSSLESESIRRSATREREGKRTSQIKEAMEMKRSFERRISIAEKNSLVSISGISSTSDSNASTSKTTNLNERSVSDTTAFSRFGYFNENAIRDSSMIEADAKSYRIRQLWLPIARRTVQWFANREERSRLSKYTQQPDA